MKFRINNSATIIFKNGSNTTIDFENKEKALVFSEKLKDSLLKLLNGQMGFLEVPNSNGISYLITDQIASVNIYFENEDLE